MRRNPTAPQRDRTENNERKTQERLEQYHGKLALHETWEKCAIWDDLWSIQLEHNRKIKSLLDRIGKEALSKTLILNMEGVPRIHDRRILSVDKQVYRDAIELGSDKLFGLDLVVDRSILIS